MSVLFLTAALGFTIAMFATKRMELGFPSAIFWALTGGYAYTVSTATWDMYYFLFFTSLVGMVPFSAFAAFGLRTKKEELKSGEEYIDEGEDGTVFVDEKAKKPVVDEEEAEMSPRRKEIRSRAKTRRTGRSGSKFDSLGFRYD